MTMKNNERPYWPLLYKMSDDKQYPTLYLNIYG